MTKIRLEGSVIRRGGLFSYSWRTAIPLALADHAATVKCGYNAEIVKDLFGNEKVGLREKRRGSLADPAVRFLGATSLYHFGVASGRNRSLE